MNNVETPKSFSPEEVEQVLSSLGDDKTKMAFLSKLYTPGNKEIAELLIPYDRNVVEKELLFALQINDQERVMEMAKKDIDYYLKNNYHILLRDKIKAWGNQDIIQYVLSKLGKGNASLENEFYLLERFGTPEQIKQNREALLTLEMNNHEYPFIATNLLNELERYDEAIDRNIEYLNNDQYYLIRDAWNIAKEHAPHRQKEIAEIVYKKGPIEEVLYYECGMFLGKEAEVRSAIKNAIKDILYSKVGILGKHKKDISNEPRFFYEIAEVMKKLGGFEKEIADLSQQIEKFVNTKENFVADAYKEMANFFAQIGNKEKSLERFGKVLDYEIEQCHPSHAQSTIEMVEELYGEGIVDNKKMLICEKNGKFLEAADIAEKLGFHAKADAYKKTASVLGGEVKE